MSNATATEQTSITEPTPSPSSHESPLARPRHPDNEEQHGDAMHIIDSRDQPNPKQVVEFGEALRVHNIREHLDVIHKFLGDYADKNPDQLLLLMVDGKLGHGQVILNQDNSGSNAEQRRIEIAVPIMQDVINKAREQKATAMLTPTEITTGAYAIMAQVALHEAVHGMLFSRPDSQFDQDFSRISQSDNDDNQTTTLLDEGIAYAFTDIFAPQVQGISLETKLTDDLLPIERQRILLGKQMRGLVEAYLAQQKPLDEAFFVAAAPMVQTVLAQESQQPSDTQPSES